MNGTIDAKAMPEFSATYLRWLISLTIVVLLLVFFIEPKVTNQSSRGNEYLAPAGSIAAVVRMEHGIKEFRGEEIEPIDAGKRTQALIYLILSFVAAPVFSFFLAQKTGADSADHPAVLSPMATVRTFLFLVCITGASLILITTVVASIKAPMVFDTMKKDNAMSEERDMAVNDLVFAYADVVRHHFQSKKYGGTKKNIAEVRSLSELGIPEKTAYGTLHLQPITSDSLVMIVVVGTTMVGKGDYKNIDGSTGRIQYTVQINPSALWHSIEKNN